MFIQDTIYQLQRRYGFSGMLYKISAGELDLDTGVQGIITSAKRVKRMVLLPRTLLRKLGQAQGYIDPDKMQILIEHFSDFEVTVGDFLIYRDQRFNITEVNSYEYDAADILTVQADTRESAPPITFNLSIGDVITFATVASK